MLFYLKINPIAFHISLLKVHWYGLMYLFSFVTGWLLLLYRAKKSQGEWTKEQIADLIFYIAIGVIFGGRLGYMFFYDFPNFIHAPWIIVKVWQGGMSFHGGLLGSAFMLWLWARKYKKSLMAVADFVIPVAPIGLAAGRIGNFINGYLWGRVTHVPWAMVYPQAGPLPRHPSEIYEFLLEGVLLFIVLWWFSSKPRPRWAVSGLFLLLYGCFRVFCEFFRQPDPQLGFIAFGWLTMGQLLSIPMIIVGAWMLGRAYRRKTRVLHRP